MTWVTVLPSAVVPRADRTWTIVVGGGSGQRFGTLKQYELLGDRASDRSCPRHRRARRTDGVVVVVPAAERPQKAGSPVASRAAHRCAPALPRCPTMRRHRVRPRRSPTASPPPRSYRQVIAAVRAGADGAIPGCAGDRHDQGRRRRRGGGDARPVHTGGRADTAGVPSPMRSSPPTHGRGDATDDAALVEALRRSRGRGGRRGDNRKITHPDDLTWARDGSRRWTYDGCRHDRSRVPSPEYRVGQGFDIHRFSDDPARMLVLGGCDFAGDRGLVGHSDADAVAHACADALLGRGRSRRHRHALPRHRPALAGRRFAHAAAPRGSDAGRRRLDGRTSTAPSCASVPKLAPMRAEMQRNLSRLLPAPVTVKGNRAEQLGALGRGEGVACFASR